MTIDLATLRRWPDFEAPELRAWDAADTLILDEAEPMLTGSAAIGSEVTVIGDDYGALTLGALAAGARGVRVHQDSLAGELALRANGDGDYESLALEAPLVAGAQLVLLRLPRSLAALDEIAALIACHAAPDVTVIAGGRIKHMSLGMNEVLLRHFGRLDVSLARQKSRLLIAREPHRAQPTGQAPEPQRKYHDELGLWVVATGGVFAGTGIDIGTRALLEVLDRVPQYSRAIDLGCGTGLLAARLAQLRPEGEVLASDQSAAAVASARLTMEANGLPVTVTRDDALAAEPDKSADLIVTNPPFHVGSAVDSRIAQKLFEGAARVLKPGGELWAVWNSHLAYRPVLERIVGPTREISRNTKFTVTASTRRTQ